VVFEALRRWANAQPQPPPQWSVPRPVFFMGKTVGNGGNTWVNGKDWLDVFVFPSLWVFWVYNFEILKNSGHAKNNT
jgi:hypothetical protein